MKRKVLLVFAFLTITPYLWAEQEIYSAAFALKKLFEFYGKDVSIVDIEAELKLKDDIPSVLVKIGREWGLYLNRFSLACREEINKLQGPVIIRYKGNFYLLILKPKGLYLISNKGEFVIDQKEFLKYWSGDFISLPLANVLLIRYKPQKEIGRIVFLYSYHNEEFYLFKQAFDRLYREAKKCNYRLIYMDELGLIPEKSVHELDSFSDSERDAFESAKHSLLQELKLIERGVGISDPTEFYDKIYKYLAKFKIRVDMEDLKYENWKAITAFDKLELNQLAVKLFCHGNIEGYVDKIREYNQGFWEYNVLLRDRYFQDQMEKLAERNPHTLIFTLRGLGHYGMEENIMVSGFTTETMILGEGEFKDLLVPDQYIQILNRNGVYVDPGEERISYLRAFPVECLRNYLQKRLNFSISEATIKANQVIKNLKEEEIERLALDISHGIAEGRLRNSDAVYEFVYWWLKKKKLVLDW